jgi:hypothetical protein
MGNKEITNKYKGNETIVDLSCSNLHVIPPEIFELKELRELVLSQNKISEIPYLIGNLTKLEKLNCEYNKITKISSSITRLKKLSSFGIGYDDFENLEQLSVDVVSYLMKICSDEGRVKLLEIYGNNIFDIRNNRGDSYFSGRLLEFEGKYFHTPDVGREENFNYRPENDAIANELRLRLAEVSYNAYNAEDQLLKAESDFSIDFIAKIAELSFGEIIEQDAAEDYIDESEDSRKDHRYLPYKLLFNDELWLYIPKSLELKKILIPCPE